MNFQIMKPIDDFIYDKVQDIKETPQYQSFVEDFNNYDEGKQNFIKIILTFLLFSIPILLVFITFIIHSSRVSNLATTEEIIATGMRIIEKDSTISIESKSLMGPPVKSRSDFSSAMNRAATSSAISPSKISVQNFNLNEEKGFNIIKADVKFSELSDKEFFGFLKNINTRNKFRIEEIDIKKNSETNLLEGLITFLHYDNAIAAPVEEEQ